MALDRHQFITRPWTLRHDVRTMRQATEATRDELRRVAESVDGSSGDVVRAIRESAEQNQAVLQWGFSEVIGSLHDQTEVLKQMLDTLREPQRTKSLEQLRNGIRAFERGVQQAFENSTSDGANRWFDDAISDFRKAVSLNKYESRGYWYLGWIYLDQGNGKEAWEAFDHAAHYSWPDYPKLSANALIGRSIVEEQRGRMDNAVSTAREAVSRSPHDPVTHYHLARNLATNGACDAAEEHVRNAIYLDTDYFTAAAADPQFRRCTEVDRLLAQLMDSARANAREMADALLALAVEAESDFRKWERGSRGISDMDEVVSDTVEEVVGGPVSIGYIQRGEGRSLGNIDELTDVRQLTQKVRSSGNYSWLAREVPNLVAELRRQVVSRATSKIESVNRAYQERAKGGSCGCWSMAFAGMMIFAGFILMEELRTIHEPATGFFVLAYSFIAVGGFMVFWWVVELVRSQISERSSKRMQSVVNKWQQRSSEIS